MAKLQITYVKSAIGYSQDQKDTIKGLGLRKLNSTVIHNDTPSIRGMAFKVRHLVAVAEIVGDDASPAPAPRATLVPEVAAMAPAKAYAQDDLEAIEGIGPKIAGIMRAAGITTFAELAASEVNTLNEILQGANLRLADPTTWPEQAKLAADGNWEAFKALQESLKGGRRE